MPFGLRNAPATFQRLMNRVLKDTTNFAKCYIDDISVYSQAWTEHIDHITEVLTSLQTAGLTLQLSKCKLGGQSCEFLGHHVSAGAISPQTAKVEAMIYFRRPLQKKDVRSFLGLIGYYRHYIPQFSSLAAPLPKHKNQNRPGKSNGNADGLSRQAWPTDDTPKKEREMSGTSEDRKWLPPYKQRSNTNTIISERNFHLTIMHAHTGHSS